MISQIISTIIAFLVTFFITPYAIRYFRFVKITTKDLHKKNKPLLPSSAGVPLASGIISGLLVYVFIQVFLYGDVGSCVHVFAALTSILIIMLSGFLDDINSSQVRIGKYLEGKRGLKAWQKPLLTLPAALPLMVIMAGTHVMSLPFVGSVDFGLLYPLVIIPIGVVGAANMVNMLGGFNGLEAGMGLVYTLGLGIFSYINGSMIAAIVFLTTFGSLLAILRYNFYPAKILPGDSLTYTLGAVVAVGAVIGNIERAAIITMLPFIIQGILKFYSYFKLGHFASDLGILQKDNTIKSKYGKHIYSWTHFVMRLSRFTEKQIVLIMMGIQSIFTIIPFLLI